MPRVPISDLQDYLEEDQGEQVPRKISRKEKKERKESLPPPKFNNDEY